MICVRLFIILLWVYLLCFYNYNDGVGMKKFIVVVLVLIIFFLGSVFVYEVGEFFMCVGLVIVRFIEGVGGMLGYLNGFDVSNNM